MVTAAVPTTRSTTRQVALAAVLASVLASCVNVALALAAVAAGVPATAQLGAPGVILISVLAASAGAIGWNIVRRRSSAPRQLLARLVPAVLVLSFAPDLLLAFVTVGATGIAPVGTLALMHLTTIAIAVAVYVRLLPVATARRRS